MNIFSTTDKSPLSSNSAPIVALITAYVGCGVYSLAYSTLAGLTFNNITHSNIEGINNNIIDITMFNTLDSKIHIKNQ